MKELSSKVKILPQSSIRQMTILANKHQAINVAQGYPEFDLAHISIQTHMEL